MNKAEFLSSLQGELSGLPIEERQAAIKYYEEYFEEAGPEREQEILDELVGPREVAATILKDYSSVPAVANGFCGDEEKNAREAFDKAEQARAGAANARDTEYRSAEYRAEPHVEQPGQAKENSGYFWESWKLPVWAWVLILVCAAPILLRLLSGVAGLALGILGGLAGLLIGAMALVFTGIAAFFAVGIAGIAMVLGGLCTMVVGVVSFVTNPAMGILAIGLGALLASAGLLVSALGFWIAVKIFPRVLRAVIELVKKMVAGVTRAIKGKRSDRV